MHKVIVNTTPLIALCHVGQLDILKKIYGEVEVMILAKEKNADIVIREQEFKSSTEWRKNVDNI